jgi:hypothetical protein
MLPTNPNAYSDGQFYDPIGRPYAYLTDGVPAFVTLAASGQVVAAAAGFKIRVYAVVLSALLATAVKFQSSTGSVDKSMTFSMAANGGFVLPQVGNQGWFETAVGDALNLNMTVATTVGVQVIYALVQ